MVGNADAFAALVERAVRVARVAADLVGDVSLLRQVGRATVIEELHDTLDVVEKALAAAAATHSDDAERIGVALHELADLRLGLRAYDLGRRRAAFDALQDGLRHLRNRSTSEELFALVPHQVASLGFNRVLYSSIEQNRWIPVAYHTESGPEEARAVMSASGPPYRLIGEFLESELVRRRRAMLVHDALHNPRVHPDLQAVIRSRSYVAAPVLSAEGTVAGFISADQSSHSDGVDDFDRDVVAMFAEGLGLALTRIAVHEEMSDVRTRLGRHAEALHDIMAELNLPQPSSTPTLSTPPTTRRSHRSSPVSNLTRREQEVLDLVAEGLSNAAIAQALYITDGTAKTHVKSILRKLGARNRAEAAALRRREP